MFEVFLGWLDNVYGASDLVEQFQQGSMASMALLEKDLVGTDGVLI